MSYSVAANRTPLILLQYLFPTADMLGDTFEVAGQQSLADLYCTGEGELTLLGPSPLDSVLDPNARTSASITSNLGLPS